MMAGSDAAPSKGRIQKRKTNPLQIVKSSLQRTAGPYKSAMCGRLRFGKSFLHGFAALVVAAMCSAF
jgi:hypothetical protein